MNRRGLTLIELIVSMVIIAIVFTIVPKIIFASNKSAALSIKEDGIFNAVTLTASIVRLPWDENTIASGGKILHTATNDCSVATGYRIGGFIGSRNCIGSAFAKSAIAQEGSDYNDIDDFNGYSEDATQGRAYNLGVRVAYGSGDDNVKEIETTLKGGAKMPGFQTSFFYESYNLGHIQINKRTW